MKALIEAALREELAELREKCKAVAAAKSEIESSGRFLCEIISRGLAGSISQAMQATRLSEAIDALRGEGE